MRLRRPSLSLLLLLFVLGSIAVPTNAQFGRNKIQYKNHKWKVMTTPHFEIHFYDGAEGFASRAAIVLEDGYAMLSEKLDEQLPWRVPVILYSNHNDFLQTNVSRSFLSEGIQAFAEPSRKRIVLPFTGSFPAFAHTAIHELAHVFTFEIVYNRLLDNVFSRNALFGMPLWIAEGVAEYLAIGWDAESDMFIRDAVIHDYLPDLQWAGGWMVYKGGQSAFNYIADTYGEEKVRELLDALAATRSAAGALERTLGLTPEEFSKRWQKEMRKKYWPLFGELTEVDEVGRRLTNHIEERAAYNTKPVLSPDGERIAFFSTRGGLISIYLMSTIDGKVIRKLVSGHRTSKFESLHFFTSSICFSPDGRRLGFVAKGGGRDRLYIVDAEKGRVLKKIDVAADGLSSPDWSPIGDKVVMSATFAGQTDLVLVDVESGKTSRLTNDVADQLHPKFFPNGRRIAFVYYPEVTVPVPNDLTPLSRRVLSEMDFLDRRNIVQKANMDIYSIDTKTRVIRPLVATAGNDDNPVLFDEGRKMLFTSYESGISNLYVADLEVGEYRRITDVLGGIFTPDINEEKGRIVFSSFYEGGYDIYVSDDLRTLLSADIDGPLASVPGLVAPPQVAGVLQDVTAVQGIPMATLLRKTHEPPKLDESNDNSVFSLADEDTIAGLALAPPISADALFAEPRTSFEDRSSGPGEDTGGESPSAKAGRLLEGVSTPVEGGEIEDRGASVADYKLRLAPDFIGQGGGLYFSTGYGFALANTIAMSDMLGNHRATLSFNIFKDIADSDILVSYLYLKRRTNYGFGAFQYKNFLNSRVTTIGESFADYQLFTERNYGVFGLVSFPFSTFDRVDFEVEAFITERQFFDRIPQDDFTLVVEGEKSKRNLIEPSITFVHDATFYDPFGPIDGSRWMLSVSKATGYGQEKVSRATAFADYRKYVKLWHRNSLAFRVAGAVSEGHQPRTFFLGGPTTLRGYDYLDFAGSRMAILSAEYRFPLVDALILGWPGRWGIGNIRGSTFFDIGSAWDKSDIEIFRTDTNNLVFQDVYGDIGVGIQMWFAYFLMNFQVAWQTDLQTIGRSQFHFYIGPAF
ncbi:MAG: BamA/TamA family outer membrane protein [bacterium]|nr:BamA/TamA family outer membrane protein [bacterium]